MTLNDEWTKIQNESAMGSIKDIIKTEMFKDYDISITDASGKGENYLGVLQRIKVTGSDENGKQKEKKLILKVPMISQAMRDKCSLGRLYNREIKAYISVLPKLNEFQNKFNIPQKDKFKYIKCHKAGDEEFKEFLIFDDMREKGFFMSDRKQSMNIKQLKLTISALANFHALSFAMKQNDPESLNELTKDLDNPMKFTTEQAYFLDILREKASSALENPKCIEKLQEFGVGLLDKLNYYLDMSTAGAYNVICHGDCWINNILFKYEDSDATDVILLDWQIMRFTSPVTDLAYLMFSSTDEELRREHYDHLMDFYYDCLKSRLTMMNVNIEDVFPETVYRDHIKKFMPFGLIIALMILPIIMSEVEDSPNMEELVGDQVSLDDMKFSSEISTNRYETRIRGVVGDFVRLGLI